MKCTIYSLLLLLVLGSMGCRMCGSPYDYCMPAFLERPNDYRDCDPLYRSGSIFQTGDCYRGYGDDSTIIEDRSVNAGNFGVTTPADARTGLGPQRGPTRTIGKPPTQPTLNGNGYDAPTRGIEELLRDSDPGKTTPLMPTPLENIQPVTPPVSEPAVETMPFTMPSVHEPTITVEDLKRLDPSVTDIKIITVDDALDTAAPKRNPSR